MVPLLKIIWPSEKDYIEEHVTEMMATVSGGALCFPSVYKLITHLPTGYLPSHAAMPPLPAG